MTTQRKAKRAAQKKTTKPSPKQEQQSISYREVMRMQVKIRALQNQIKMLSNALAELECDKAELAMQLKQQEAKPEEDTT